MANNGSSSYYINSVLALSYKGLKGVVMKINYGLAIYLTVILLLAVGAYVI